MKGVLHFRRLLALAILTLSTVLTLVVIRNFRGGGPEEIVEALPGNIDLSLKEIRYTETLEGRKRWTLVADAADYRRQEQVSRVENIHLTFHDRGKGGDVVLTARQGEVKTDARVVEVWGDVVVKTAPGSTLFADRMEYRDRDHLVRSAGPVRLEAEGLVLTGTGVRLDIETRRVEILDDVQARIDVAEGRKGH